jgi:hypothetical protein
MKRSVLPIAAGILLFSCSVSRKNSKRANEKTVQPVVIVKADTVKRNVKAYSDVIPGRAITQNGLFKIHKVDERYFFEIPDSLLNRDLLVVNRIIKAPPFAGLSGDAIGESLIQFTKELNNKVYIKRNSFLMRSNDSTERGMFQAVERSNFQPIVAAFDIKAFSKDSACVIDLTDYINSDNDILFFDVMPKRQYQIEGLMADKSYITGVKCFPSNVEIKTVKTFTRLKRPVTYELNSSLVLLSKDLMKPRYMDKRVGYFGKGYYDYNAERPVNEKWMITRWRLEPKDEDIEKYKAGQLVEPKKPIVFYIDPATPKKWVPYLIQGVNDWQKAFEKAGFKNAIYALEAPKNDSTWNLEDARHSAIVYKATAEPNARGPQVSDPRTGEILESHIEWFHNIQQLLHDWYMIQASPNDPGAGKMVFDDSLMGRLIRYVCTHEVGHTLGLTHNFGASSTIPVDSIRNKNYIKAHGFCPSIMDYARFNYVAQPEDSLNVESLMPRIGVYDEWAIQWGYKWFNNFKTEKEEKEFLTNWVSKETQKDSHLWYGEQGGFPLKYNWDPKKQNEDLGDNSVKASYYGILNLKRVIGKLEDWTVNTDDNNESLKNLYNALRDQYINYIYHVVNNIGGTTWVGKYVKGKQEGIAFSKPETQKAAVQFLQDQLFTTPTWLMNESIFQKSVGSSVSNINIGHMYKLMNIQGEVLTRITSHATYSRLLVAQTTLKEKTYTINELLNDLKTGIWKELKTKAPIDIYRRNLQKVYVERFIRQLNYSDKTLLLTPEDDMLFAFENIFSDVFPTIKTHLAELLAEINRSMPGYKDRESISHLMEVRDRIKFALVNTKNGSYEKKEKTEISNSTFNLNEKPASLDLNIKKVTGCWTENY